MSTPIVQVFVMYTKNGSDAKSYKIKYILQFTKTLS